MQLLDESAPWLQNLSIAEDGIVTGQNGWFGLGAVLIIEHQWSQSLVFVKKSYRPEFEGNDQFAFPGGMVRSNRQEANLPSMIWHSLAARVAAEVKLDLQLYRSLKVLDGQPPVVAAYSAKGQRRHTVILPFILRLTHSFMPASQDSTVYAAQWQQPMSCWAAITPTNRLIAAYYLWPRLSEEERANAKPSVKEALRQATGWAKEVKLPSPALPWSEAKETTGEKAEERTLANQPRHRIAAMLGLCLI